MDLFFRVFGTICLLAASIAAIGYGFFEGAYYFLLCYVIFANIAWLVRQSRDCDND